MSDGARILVVNADDFGRSHGVNAGVIKAHEQGIVTSASLMVRWPAAAEAAAYARGRTALAVGLHLDLAEWRRRNGRWEPLYEVVDVNDPAAVASEFERQLAAFRGMLRRDPTHLDSHQHVHRDEPVRSALLAGAATLGVPARDLTPSIRYSGSFYGHDARENSFPETIGVDALLALLGSLRAGVTELGCHPGLAADFETSYSSEREREVETLCDPRVRARIEEEGIGLYSFADLLLEAR